MDATILPIVESARAFRLWCNNPGRWRWPFLLVDFFLVWFSQIGAGVAFGLLDAPSACVGPCNSPALLPEWLYAVIIE
ncbi:hypothetical protein Nepgr_024011 [Nepenthes gracilis]|uniref:Uncharacterized protein n=1 Tax=Nepenthes gracilis TaxID=150966 RepID=A0AAD3XYD8_NEPGR|nr:hypothetical protein Nepgr_024011 [Nepenthes gracilis]